MGAALMDRRAIWLSALFVSNLFVMALGSIILIPQWLYPSLGADDLRGVDNAQTRIQLQQAQSQLRNTARSEVLQDAAGLLVVIGAAAAWRQVQVAREGQITERFTRAVDHLGSQNIDVRIGGIYALERIANNSPADRNAIQYLLGAFVRNHAPWPVGTPGGPQHPIATVDEHLPWMRVRAPDIQTAMGVLGRRAPSRDTQVIYLSRVDLRSVALRGAHFTGAKFRHANLARAVLAGVWLDDSDLTEADLRRAFLENTRLSRANLSNAVPAENLVRAGQAACSYSCRMPPRRSRHRMSRWATCSGSVSGVGSGFSDPSLPHGQDHVRDKPVPQGLDLLTS
jgi:hypothetical protein